MRVRGSGRLPLSWVPRTDRNTMPAALPGSRIASVCSTADAKPFRDLLSDLEFPRIIGEWREKLTELRLLVRGEGERANRIATDSETKRINDSFTANPVFPDISLPMSVRSIA